MNPAPEATPTPEEWQDAWPYPDVADRIRITITREMAGSDHADVVDSVPFTVPELIAMDDARTSALLWSLILATAPAFFHADDEDEARPAQSPVTDPGDRG